MSSVPQLFTDYGRLAMESSDVKPFQVLPNKEISIMTTCLYGACIGLCSLSQLEFSRAVE